MKKYFLNLLLTIPLVAGMYDSPYSIVDKKADAFSGKNFLEIRNFDVIEFNDGRVLDTSKDNLKAIITTIKSYIESGKQVQVRVIGHTPMQRDRNRELDRSSQQENTYNLNNMFRFSDPEDIEEDSSTVYASYIVSKLENKNIPKEIITKEFRSTRALGLDIEKEKKINLPNQVLVMLYVLAPRKEVKQAPVVVAAKEVVVQEKEMKPEPVVVAKEVVVEAKAIKPEAVLVQAKEIVVPAKVTKPEPVVVAKEVVVEKKEVKPEPVLVQVKETAPKPVVTQAKEVLASVAEIKDSDGDNVPDNLDKCPKTRGQIKVDSNGCPYDTDKDGILDYRDVCSDTPFGDAVYENGCSIRKKLRLNFASKSTKIPLKSYVQIKKLAGFLKQNKEYTIKVIGHTSRTSVSNAAYNLKLSKKRAKAVENALVKYGVPRVRLTSLGKGFHEPIADNSTEEGRALNRRIEVKLFK